MALPRATQEGAKEVQEKRLSSIHKIANVSQRPLKWEQPSLLKWAYELRAGEELFATMDFRNIWGTQATAKSGDGCWTYKQGGFWQNKPTIRVCGVHSNLAVFKHNSWTGGGTLEFEGGPTFKAATNFWMTHYEFQTGAGETLVRFKHSGVFRLSSEVEIHPMAQSLVELPILVTFGWYLAIMLYNLSMG